jgi:hypothetical protein
MSWLGLLMIGRSWGRAREGPGRYKMTQQSLLPKFGKPRDDDRPLSDANRKAAPQPDGSVSARVRENTVNDRIDMSIVDLEIPAVRPATPLSPPPAFPSGRWTVFQKPFFRTPKPEVSAAPVQGELSLDAVTPVRNDLSDSDLEVVGTGRVEPVSPESPALDDLVWRHQKSQLFSASKV